MTSEKLTLELVDTDAPHLCHDELEAPQSPDICDLTSKSIVNPPATLEELRRRIEKAASLSPAAQIRRVLRVDRSKVALKSNFPSHNKG